MTAVLVIKPHPSASVPVLIPDLGYLVNSGGVELTSLEEIESARESDDLRSLLTDDAFGAGSSTLRLNDGTNDIPQSEALNFLDGADHERIYSLVHNLAETSYQEITRTGGVVTSIIVWTDSGKTTKVRETTISRTGGQVSQTVEKQYDGTGSLVQTLTSTFTRTDGQVTSVDVVET